MCRARLAIAAVLAIPLVAAADATTLSTYLQRYHQLAEDDVEGRVALALWCAEQGLAEQQIRLLAEVLKLRPDHPDAYDALIKADADRTRPPEADGAAVHRRVLDARFRLHRSRHFTLLTDMPDEAAGLELEDLEAAYATFYGEVPKLGLRPMPPEQRLVCILFARGGDFHDFLRRIEGMGNVWGAGYYSQRSNRVCLYHEADSVVFADARRELAEAHDRIAALEGELRRVGPEHAARRAEVERAVQQLKAGAADLARRLAAAQRLATLSKTRHEVTHQLLFNSGIFRRGRQYPFWLSEGLATLFEAGDATGRAAPELVSPFRLKLYLAAESEGRVLPVAELIAYEPVPNQQPEVAATRYTEAWALMHVLWNRRGEQLRRYMLEVREQTPRDWPGLFRRHFGDLGELEAELRRYMRAHADKAAEQP